MGKPLKDPSTFNPPDRNLDLSQANKNPDVSITLCIII